MKYKISILLLLFLTSACAMPMPAVGPGIIVTNTTEGVSVNNGVAATRKGEACGKNFLGIASVGDATIEAAKNKSGINNVATVNIEYFSVLGIYAQACTVVSGN